jgi:hypothetical protein
MTDHIERALAAFYPDWAEIVRRFPNIATDARARMTAALRAAAPAQVEHNISMLRHGMINISPPRLGQGAVGETVRLG